MEKKMAALTLLTLTALAAVIGGLILTAQATETDSTTTDTTIATTDTTPTSTMTDQGGFLMEDRGRGGHGGHGGGMGGMGAIEVSSEYTENVNVVLEADTDVQNLISEGYTVATIKPIIKSVVGADGTVTAKATTAIVFLENGTSGHATVDVDVENAAVTRIVITTRTVIDKTSS